MKLLEKLRLKLTKKDISISDVNYQIGLEKASNSLSKQLIETTHGNKEVLIEESFFKDVEKILITADIGVYFTDSILKIIRKRIKINNTYTSLAIKEIIVEAILSLVEEDENDSSSNLEIIPNSLNVILVSGVNGSGKTTSIAKLSKYLQAKNYKIIIVAADTFRAAAVEQLSLWANKLNIECIKPIKELQDPASVVFDGIKYAKDHNHDIVIIDTAGRLHSNNNLMAELHKIYNILVNKLSIEHIQTLLVLDATTGQNGINQAKTFKETTNVDGIILTKMDGTSKGGIILSIKDKLKIPVKFIGLGEKIDDLKVFNLEEYLYNLVKPIIEEKE